MATTQATPGTKCAKVAGALRGRIASGKLAVGDALPGENELSRRYQVSRMTVRAALHHLEADGMISREQGKGTFVSSAQPVPAGMDAGLLHILFLLIDVSPEQDYNFREIATTERYLSERDIPFSWAALSSEDLVRGRFPTLLEKGMCQGVILDGHVTDAHMALADRFGVKVLAVGNHDLDRRAPQVRSQTQEATRRMVSRLAEAGKRRVALAVEPLRLANTRDMQAGYTDALQELGHVDPLVYLCRNDEPPPGLIDLLCTQRDTTALFTTDPIFLRIVAGLGLRTGAPFPVPACVITPRPIDPCPSGPVHQLCFKSEQAQTLAVERLLDLVQGRRDSVFEELDVEHLPPGNGPSGSS